MDGPAKTIITIEPGIFRRISHRTGKALAPLWIHYAVNGRTFREPAGTTNVIKARQFRARRMEEHRRGEPGRRAERVLVNDLLDALVAEYEVNARASLRTARGHVAVLRP